MYLSGQEGRVNFYSEFAGGHLNPLVRLLLWDRDSAVSRHLSIKPMG